MKQKQLKKTSRIAIASIIFALAAITSVILFVLIPFDIGFFVVAALRLPYISSILGIIGLFWISFHHKVLKGYSWAFLAIILCLPFLYVERGITKSVKERDKKKKLFSGLYNLELLGEELFKYTKGHDGYLPDANNWCDVLMSFNENITKENFKHPQAEKGLFKDAFDLKGECHFAFNRNLSGMKLSEIPDDVVLLFEADGAWNLNGTSKLLKTRYREKGYIAMLFVDQSIGNYWFYKEAVRKFDAKGTHMYYEKPRWKP